ncbi:C-type lectin domain family 4 member M-like isoform X1 [Triplophysa dalaica]|uniref:C-type lectin domain family 4 member M-like isoform X1 n=1 Tax=Triplophysa dalaica TaxID=1582913 RepID=UPI0024DF81BD|nr:C-type lectin domain family 4 member M-like isoform X1 [Triplophysa dalaica]
MSGSVNDSRDKSSIMDGEEKEERIVDIYITAEAVRDIKHKKQTEESETTTRPPEHTGSETVRNRSPRSVLVCLVVLCVLLLTAVIVLCVLIYTNNHQFHINNKNITEERDQLLTKYTNITEERDQLLTKYTNITQERDQLLTKYTNITEERDELRVNFNNISVQCEQFRQEKNKLLEFLQLGGWIYYESSLYFFSSEKNNWTESRRYCTQRGADLFIINNIEEQYFVGNTSDSSTQHIWIGLYKVADTWKWVDNSTMTSERWGDKEPNGGNNANCVETSGSFWNDHDCSTNLKWICEKKILI